MYNLDEAAIVTVQKSSKNTAAKGVIQISKVPKGGKRMLETQLRKQ